ncbi:DUF6887 family protein [Phormidesmis sp. 146-12]
MKPDFAAMSRKELREYLLTHREDEEAFFAFVDRSEAEGNWIELPPVESSEGLQNFPEFLKKLNSRREE